MFVRHIVSWRLLLAVVLSLPGLLRAEELSATNALTAAAAFSRGEALYQSTNWTGAAEAYTTVLTHFPDGTYATQALYSRGWALFQAGDYEGAWHDFRTFREKFPDHALAAECLLKTGDSLRLLRRFDEALRVYEQVRATGGRYLPGALAGIAWVLYAQHDVGAAQTAFCEAAQAYGHQEQATALLFNAGSAAMEAHHFPAAADLFSQVQQAGPTNALACTALYWQALALYRQDKVDEAAARLNVLWQSGVPRELAAAATLLLAQVQDARHNYGVAAALYAGVATNNPGPEQAETAAAGGVVALEKAGDLPAAEAAAMAFVLQYPASPQRPGIQFLVGEYRYRQANYDAAVPELEKFVAAYPTHELAASALFKAGWCYWNLKQTARARERFAGLVANYARSPLAAEAASLQARAAETAGDVSAARDAYREAVRLGQDNDTAQRAAVELMRLDQASKHYEEALTQAHAFIARHATGNLLPRVRLYRAEALLELGRLPEALQAYQQVGESDPVAAAGAAYGAGWVLRRQGKHGAAAEAFARVAQGSSSYAADALFWSARSYEDAGVFNAASDGYGACLRQTPPGAHADEAAYRQAYCLWQTRKPDDAERLYSSILQERAASPFAANALYDLAWVMMEQGKKAEARQRFEEFARQYPKHLLAPDAHFRIGELACEKEEYAVAEPHYEVAATAQVSFRDKALFKLGWVREKLGQQEAAAQTYLRLARQFATSEFAPEAQYRAGCLLQSLGKFDEARTVFAAVAESVFSEKAACGVAECWRAEGKHLAASVAYGVVLTKWPQGECRVPALLGRAGEWRASGAFADAISDYSEVSKVGGESRESAQAMLGQGQCWFALKKWEEAARCFLKVDVLYGFDELKPEALAMAARCWDQAGDAAKAAMYREELKKRFPKAKEAQVQ